MLLSSRRDAAKSFGRTDKLAHEKSYGLDRGGGFITACLKTKSQTWRNCPMAGVVGALFLFHLKNYPFAGKKAFTIKDTIRMPKPPGARVVNASSQARESNNRGEKPRHSNGGIAPSGAVLAATTRLRSRNCSLVEIPRLLQSIAKTWGGPVPSGSTRSSTTVRPHSDRTARARAEEAWRPDLLLF